MIHYIEIAGQERPLAFGMSLLLRYERESGKSIGEVFRAFSEGAALTEVLRLITLALNNGQRKHNLAQPAGTTLTERAYTLDEVADLLDDSPPDTLTRIMELFSDGMPQAEPNGEAEGEEKKSTPAAPEAS